MSIIEQTLTALARIDEVGFVELTLDSSIYPHAVILAAAADASKHCLILPIDDSAGCIRVTALDPGSARQAIGVGVMALTKFAIQSPGQR